MSSSSRAGLDAAARARRPISWRSPGAHLYARGSWIAVPARRSATPSASGGQRRRLDADEVVLVTSSWHARRAGRPRSCVPARIGRDAQGGEDRRAEHTPPRPPRARRVGRRAGARPRCGAEPARLSSMRRTWTAALIVVALAGVAAGCGGSSDERDGSDGRLGERLLQRRHDMDGRPAWHHAAVHGHVEPLAGRARVGGRGRADVDGATGRARSKTSGRPRPTRARRSRARSTRCRPRSTRRPPRSRKPRKA